MPVERNTQEHFSQVKTSINIGLYLILSQVPISSLAQTIQNGDLEGEVVNGVVSQLPDYWQNVPFDDPSCYADQPTTATPDLAGINGPHISSGFFGKPYSGNSFVLGGFSSRIDSKSGDTLYGHEGIMQEISGFRIGCLYTLTFAQCFINIEHFIDTTGVWALLLDNVIVEKSKPSSSANAFDDPELNWEVRQIQFTATKNTHVLKLLPFDDDGDHYRYEGIIMGIDDINLELTKVYQHVDFLEDSLCIDENYGIKANLGQAKFLWHDGTTDSLFFPVSPGTYWVEASNDCGVFVDTIEIKKVLDCDCKIFIPNSFTPNGDGLNDSFKVTSTCDPIKFELSIYNQWGQRVFTADDPDFSWSGTNDQSTEVYAYQLKATLPSGEFTKMGLLHLVR